VKEATKVRKKERKKKKGWKKCEKKMRKKEGKKVPPRTLSMKHLFRDALAANIRTHFW